MTINPAQMAMAVPLAALLFGTGVIMGGSDNGFTFKGFGTEIATTKQADIGEVYKVGFSAGKDRGFIEGYKAAMEKAGA